MKWLAHYRFLFWHRVSRWCWPLELEDDWHRRFDRILAPIGQIAIRRYSRAADQYLSYVRSEKGLQ